VLVIATLLFRCLRVGSQNVTIFAPEVEDYKYCVKGDVTEDCYKKQAIQLSNFINTYIVAKFTIISGR